MSDWLLDMIANTEFDEKEQAKIDSLDNIFKVKETAQFLKISPDSLANMDSTVFNQAYQAVTDSMRTDSIKTDSLARVDDIYDDVSKYDDPVKQKIRNVLSVVLPSIWGGAAVGG